jgi:hypothetical protein
MACFACTPNSFRSISRAMAKAASSRFRKMGLGTVAPDWARRAETCERCPMRVGHRGVSYCGKPLLKQIDRDPAVDGCGCPIREKAKAPGEHCPIDHRHQPSTGDAGCRCKWCSLGAW